MYCTYMYIIYTLTEIKISSNAGTNRSLSTLAQVLWNVNLWCDKQPTPTWAGGAGAAGPWSAANTKVTNSVFLGVHW